MASTACTPPIPAPGDATGLRERARGALLGLAVGDALGAPAENLRPSEIRARWGRITGYVAEKPAGTDDTEYAIFSGLLLARHGSALTPAHVEAAWHEWIADRAEGPFRGAGFSERGTLENLRRGLAAPISAQHRHAWSDGLAMRAAPFGVFAAGRPGEAARLVAIDGSISHEGEGIYGGQAVAAGVAAAMAGAPVPVVVASALAVVPDDSWTARSLRRAVAVAHRGERAVRSAVVIGGYPWTDLAPEAVALAFGAYAAADGDFREAVLTAVNMGRDADTTAAVAGALCGAAQGLTAIPPAWAAAIGPARGRCLPSMAGHHILDVAELLVPGEGGKWGADVILPELLPEPLRELLPQPDRCPTPGAGHPAHEDARQQPPDRERERVLAALQLTQTTTEKAPTPTAPAPSLSPTSHPPAPAPSLPTTTHQPTASAPSLPTTTHQPIAPALSLPTTTQPPVPATPSPTTTPQPTAPALSLPTTAQSTEPRPPLPATSQPPAPAPSLPTTSRPTAPAPPGPSTTAQSTEPRPPLPATSQPPAPAPSPSPSPQPTERVPPRPPASQPTGPLPALPTISPLTEPPVVALPVTPQPTEPPVAALPATPQPTDPRPPLPATPRPTDPPPLLPATSQPTDPPPPFSVTSRPTESGGGWVEGLENKRRSPLVGAGNSGNGDSEGRP